MATAGLRPDLHEDANQATRQEAAPCLRFYPEKAPRLAGVQRLLEVCEERGFGWCLWVHGDWADGFDTYGANLKPKATYPLITGKR